MSSPHVGRWWGRHEGGVGALGAGLGLGVVVAIIDVADGHAVSIRA